MPSGLLRTFVRFRRARSVTWGLPVVATAPDSANAQSYRDIAARVRDGLQVAGRAAPKIVIEA
jgi:hypothetical protein